MPCMSAHAVKLLIIEHFTDGASDATWIFISNCGNLTSVLPRQNGVSSRYSLPCHQVLHDKSARVVSPRRCKGLKTIHILRVL